MPFDLNKAQESARANLTSNFLSGAEKDEMLYRRRPFYIHELRRAQKEFNGEATEQWELTIELADQDVPDPLPADWAPEMNILTFGANAYRDGLMNDMKAHIAANNESIGPLKLIKMSNLKGKPWDLDAYDAVEDTKAASAPPATVKPAGAGTFRPRPN
jgi:hypothetical protein